MDERLREEFLERNSHEPFARVMGLRLVEVSDGYAKVEMEVTPQMENLFFWTHGGAIFSLIDEAFQAASNSDGVLSVALNVNVTYITPPRTGSRLFAVARELSRTKRTSSYFIEVRDSAGTLIATCQALAYRTGRQLPFLSGE
jgi:acyl-CoA thioesterase